MQYILGIEPVTTTLVAGGTCAGFFVSTLAAGVGGIAAGVKAVKDASKSTDEKSEDK